MPGVKGAGGPLPKRSDQRRRANTPAAGEPEQVVDPHEVVPLKADADWHPVAKLWFDSLGRSGQSRFYTNSDWGAAYVLAESMSRELKPQVVGNTEDGEPVWASLPPKGASLAAWLKGMTALLVTEGDRRRAAVELQRPPAKPEGTDSAGVTDIRAWKESLNA